MSETLAPTPFPWLPDSAARGTFAISALHEGLLAQMRSPQGIHAPTLLSSIGAVAGVAAQRAMWAQSLRTPQDVAVYAPEAPTNGEDLYLVRAEGAKGLYAGELLDSYLAVTEHYRQATPFWSFLGGALLYLGVPIAQHPVVRDIFAHVNARTGTDQFGYPDAIDPKLRPMAPAYTLARRFWGTALSAMTSEPEEEAARQEPPLAEDHYLAVCGAVAQQYIIMLRELVPPLAASVLVMEAAICTVKLEPAYVNTAA